MAQDLPEKNGLDASIEIMQMFSSFSSSNNSNYTNNTNKKGPVICFTVPLFSEKDKQIALQHGITNFIYPVDNIKILQFLTKN